MRRNKSYLIVFFDSEKGFDYRKTNQESGVKYYLKRLKKGRENTFLGFQVFEVLSDGELELRGCEEWKQ